jgi:hypothetical protein
LGTAVCGELAANKRCVENDAHIAAHLAMS